MVLTESIHLALDVGRVQNVVRLVRTGLLKVGVIQFLDEGVLMALAQLHVLVLAIESRRTLGAQIVEIAHFAGLVGLSAAVDATAREAITSMK